MYLVLMALLAVVVDPAFAALGGGDGNRRVEKGEGVAVMQAGLRLAYPFADEILRQMAVHASGRAGVVARLIGVIHVAHDVAACTGFRLGSHIAKAVGIPKGEKAATKGQPRE